jgi:hypothetical protein
MPPRRANRGAGRPVAGRRGAQSRIVNIFLSYHRADEQIAKALYSEIKDISPRIECFLDTERIEGGEEWKEKLDEALQAADWLICIYTGEQSDYCGYEVGVFSHTRSNARNDEDGRLVCIHDVPKIPDLFHDHQNQRVEYPPQLAAGDSPFDEAGFYSQSKLASFFRNLYAYDRLKVARDESDREWISKKCIEKAKVITLAFQASRANDVYKEAPTQLGIEVSVRCASGEKVAAVPDDARVKGTYESLRLFGLAPLRENEQLPATTWGAIKESSKQHYGTHIPWIERLERDMVMAAAGSALSDSEAIFLSSPPSRTPYRAILVSHQLNFNGSRYFNIVFVGTLPRYFLGDQKTSLMLAGLVVASRFRFAYLEQPVRIASQFSDAVSDAEFYGHYRQFLHDLERMKIESMELGLIDKTAFIQAFGERYQGMAESFLAGWEKARAALDAALPASTTTIDATSRPKIKQAIADFLAAMAPENARFLRAAVKVYRDDLELQLNKAGIADDDPD